MGSPGGNLSPNEFRFPRLELKADREAEYKQIPLDEAHSKLAVIALRSPTDGKWYGFFSRTLMFGAISAVLHYNLFSRLLTELVNKLLGTPLICFFDDFGAMVPAELASAALQTFTLFCDKLGISLKLEKTELGQRVTFLGLSGAFPRKDNKWLLQVSLPAEKASKWATEILGHIKTGSILSAPLEKLICKLGFSQTNLFGKFAHTKLRPLYQKLYARNFSPKLTQDEIRTFKWWARVLTSLQPRIPRGSIGPRTSFFTQMQPQLPTKWQLCQLSTNATDPTFRSY